MTHPRPGRPIPAIVTAIRRRREEAGITQRQLAEMVHTDWSAIRDFERGRCVVGLVKLDQRLVALQCELAIVPRCPVARAQEAADWLQAQGWSVEPPNPDARARPNHGAAHGAQAEG